MTATPSTRWRLWTGIAISIHFALILTLGLSRHWGYMSSLNDLGVFDQAAWGSLNGRFLLNTSQFNQPINWLGFHFHPVILLFVPFYAIAPYPEWFTLAQALALSVAAWPIFLLASKILKSGPAGLMWAIAYLANPFLLSAAAWDFHPITLAAPFIALGLLAVERADSRLLLLSCLPLLFIQEHLGASVAGFGLLWGLRRHGWKTATALILLGLGHLLLVIVLIMPSLSPTGAHVMFASDLGQLSRYGWLGKSVGDIALNLLLHPWSIAQTVLFDWDGWFYLGLLLLPFLGFPLAAPLSLLPAMPDLVANLLSANTMPMSAFAYHSALLAPALAIAAAYGARRIFLRWTWLSGKQISGLALTASLTMGYVFAPLPTPGSFNFWAPTHFLNAPDPALVAVREILGTASVSAQANIGAHFSQRSQIYIYPRKLDEVDAVILRLENPSTKIFPAEHLQMPVADYLASIACLLDGKRHYPVLWDDPWLVLKRGGANPAASPSPDNRIRQKLQRLRVDWQVDAEEYREALKKCGEQKTP